MYIHVPIPTGLLQDIEAAFVGGIYPGDENLVYDNTDKYLDVVETKASFRGKHWKALSIDNINRHRDNLPSFTPEAFCFYLPAWLSASVSYSLEVIDVLPANLISNLTPRNEALEPEDWLRTVISMLTAQQKRVIFAFVEWYTHAYVLDREDLPEDLKDLKRFNPGLDQANTFWKHIVSTL